MHKKFVSLLMIYSILLLSCFSSLAQTPHRLSKELNPPPAQKNNLKEIFAEEIQKSNESVLTTIDFEKLEKNSVKQMSKRNNLSGSQKTFIWVGIGAAVAVTALILLTRKKDEGKICFLGVPAPPGC